MVLFELTFRGPLIEKWSSLSSANVSESFSRKRAAEVVRNGIVEPMEDVSYELDNAASEPLSLQCFELVHGMWKSHLGFAFLLFIQLWRFPLSNRDIQIRLTAHSSSNLPAVVLLTVFPICFW